jgi:opacity protein-like surface antigen
MSKMLVSSLAAAGCAVGLLGTAQAQQQWDSPFHWHVFGGYSETVGTTADYLQGGYLFGGGFSVTPSPDAPIDLRFDASYSDHKASEYLQSVGQQNTNIAIDGGDASIWSVTANGVLHFPIAYGVRGYGIAGVGSYHTRVELTQSAAFGGGYNCDPFSGYCDGGYGGAAVVATQGVTKFGWNAGVGVEFKLPYRGSWFIEARYHRISTNTPIEFIPIEVGYRF